MRILKATFKPQPLGAYALSNVFPELSESFVRFCPFTVTFYTFACLSLW